MAYDYMVCTCRRCGIRFTTSRDVGMFGYDFSMGLFHADPVATAPGFCDDCRKYRARAIEKARAAAQRVFERSGKDRQDCSKCDGTGSISGITCPECEGQGWIPVDLFPHYRTNLGTGGFDDVSFEDYKEYLPADFDESYSRYHY